MLEDSLRLEEADSSKEGVSSIEKVPFEENSPPLLEEDRLSWLDEFSSLEGFAGSEEGELLDSEDVMTIGKELELFGISLEEASEAPPQEKSSRAGKTNNSFPRFMETIMKKGKNYAISLGDFESFCFRLRRRPTGCSNH